MTTGSKARDRAEVIEAFCFDLDGTLCNSLADITASCNAVRAHFQRPVLTEAEVVRWVGNGVAYLVGAILKGEDQQDVQHGISIFKAHYEEHCLDQAQLYPGVIATLQHFQHKKMALISNKPERFVRKMLPVLGIAGYFQVVIGGDTTAECKPARAPFALALEKLPCSPSRTVMVGDGIPDVQGGQQAGLITCAALYGFTRPNELLGLAPDYTIAAFNELQRLFH